MPFKFIEAVKRLDALRDIENPSATDAARLRELLREPENQRYFFADLDNPYWFPYLRELGLLDDPPEPVRTAEGAYRTPIWNQSRYLARMMKQFPSQIADLVVRYNTTNPWVIHDLLAAARQAPATAVATMTPAFIKWLRSPGQLQSASLAAQLMVLLGEGGYVQPALELLEALTEPRIEAAKDALAPPYQEATGPFTDYDLRETVLIQLPRLAKLEPVAVLGILERQLKKALELEKKANRDSLVSTVFWRPAIEDNEQNWLQGSMKSLMTNAIRDTLASVTEKDVRTGQTTVERYVEDEYAIFRRLAVHTIRVYPDQYRDQLIRLFETKKNLLDLDIHHEFLLLMQACFPHLSGDVQSRLLQWIEEGFDAAGYRRLFEQSEGHYPTDAEVENRRDYWVFERLWLLRDQNLPHPYAQELDGLHKRFGDPQHPEFLTYHTSYRGPSSPFKEDDLSALSVDELIGKFLLFRAENRPGEASPEGLARVFQKVVEKNASLYADQSMAFGNAQLAATYVYHFIRGLEEAAKNKNIFSWRPVLNLARVVVAREDTQWARLQADLETTPVGVRGAIADLLSLGCADQPVPFQEVLLPEVRDILLQLARDADPSPEEEKRESFDAPTLSLNSVRGKAMHATFYYAFYRAKLLGLKGNARLEPNVVSLLEDKLDKTKEPALSVHCTFGWHIPLLHFLDSKWLSEHLALILPSNPAMSQYRDAAWEGYIKFSNLYSDVFALLFAEYQRSVAGLELSSERTAALGDANSRLAEHLMLAYLNGFPDTEIDKPLLEQFFKYASEETRAHAIWFLWQAIGDDKISKDSDEWVRMRALWERRSQAAACDNKTGLSKEVSTFAYWLRVAPEGLDSLAPLIRSAIPCFAQGAFADEVVEYLKREAPQHPLLAVDLLSQVLQKRTEPLYLARESVPEVLRTALKSGDEEANEMALRLINDLSAQGDYDLLKLVDE